MLFLLGVLRSFANRQYTVDGIAHQYSIDQTIRFTECSARPVDPDVVTAQRVSVERFFVVYDDRERILRFAMTNKVAPLLSKDLYYLFYKRMFLHYSRYKSNFRSPVLHLHERL
jgi:hypothetical protein